MKFPDKAELLERFSQYSDEEIRRILTHAKDYQQAAVEAAQEIARSRGLDLEVAVQGEKPSGFSIFPQMGNSQFAEKVARSIQRVLYMIALIPLGTAALSWVDGYPSLGIAYGLLAIVWAMAAFFALSRRKHQIVLFFFPLIAAMGILRYLTAGLPLHMTGIDWAVAAICLAVLIYLVLFYKTILKSIL